MKQSTLLEFTSKAFPIEVGEDEETNPGIYGRALARWLGEQLQQRGMPAGEVFAEDFGWCLPISSESHRLYVACSSVEEAPNTWCVFVFSEGGLWARLLGRDRSAEAVGELYAQVKGILQGATEITDLCEQDI